MEKSELDRKLGDLLPRIESLNAACCCANLRSATRMVTQYYDIFFKSLGIRSTQFTLLVALANADKSTLTQISKALFMDRTTLTRNLKPLESMGYISVYKHKDRRTKSYRLTSAGAMLLQHGTQVWQEAQTNLVQALSAPEYQNLLSISTRVANLNLFAEAIYMV